MDDIFGRFHQGRRNMLAVFVELSGLALRAGVNEDQISQVHGKFFDGNVAVKKAFRELGEQGSNLR